MQACALAILTLYWFFNDKTVPQCPQSIHMIENSRDTVLCGLAGAWVIMWPVAIPLLFFFIPTYLILIIAFLQQKTDKNHPETHTTWLEENAGIPSTWGSKHVTIIFMCFFDIMCCMAILMLPYGLIPEILAFWHTAFYGNRIPDIATPVGIQHIDEQWYRRVIHDYAVCHKIHRYDPQQDNAALLTAFLDHAFHEPQHSAMLTGTEEELLWLEDLAMEEFARPPDSSRLVEEAAKSA